MSPLSEAVWALGWHLGVTALAVLTVCAIVVFGFIAVLNLGAAAGIALTLILAICAIGVASWWINGKGRPQA